MMGHLKPFSEEHRILINHEALDFHRIISIEYVTAITLFAPLVATSEQSSMQHHQPTFAKVKQA